MNKPLRHPLPAYLQAFFNQRLLAQRQLSLATVHSYRDTMRLLLHYVEQQTHRPPDQQVLEDWDAPCIQHFLEYLQKQRANAVPTRNTRLAALRTFMGFVAEQTPEALALTARVRAIPVKRWDRRLLGFLSPHEMQAVLTAPPPTTPTGQRDRLLLELMYNTGARVSEIVALSRQDVHLTPDYTVQLRGKGRKQRLMPLWKSTARHLKQWLAQHPGAPEAPLFSNHLGQRLSRFGIAQRLRCAVATAVHHCPSLQGRTISPHVIRHTTAMHLLQKGNDITLIALWLGHENPLTTHHYLELNLALKEQCLKKLPAPKVRGQKSNPNGHLLDYLKNL